MIILKIAFIAKNCPTYEERLEKLALFSLARRRLRVDLILGTNLSIGAFDLLKEQFFTRSPCSSLRGHILKLHRKRFRLNRSLKFNDR